MSNLAFSGLDDLYREIGRAGERAKPTVEKMLQAGGKEVEQAWKRAIEEARLVKNGDMIKSVKADLAIRRNGDGVGSYVEIYPRGKDRRGIRNAEKAFVNHYGNSHIRARGFVDVAEKYAEAMAVPVMEAIWDAEGR